MSPSRSGWLVVGIALFMLLPACDEGGGALTVQITKGTSFVHDLPLVEGQSDTLDVRLSQEVPETTYVDIENNYKDQVQLEPAAAVKFNPTQWKQSVTFTGLKQTNDQRVPIIFKLRNGSSQAQVKVIVSKQTVPDGGGQPDQGPTPDTGTTPDKGTTQPDQKASGG